MVGRIKTYEGIGGCSRNAFKEARIKRFEDRGG